MTLTIDFTPSEQERVTLAARQKGLEPAEFVRKLVADSLPPLNNGVGTTSQVLTVEEKIQAMNAFAETNRGLPVLSDEAFDRANLYDERL